MPKDLPKGHIVVDGQQYVDLRLSEAASQHVLEQGAYINRLQGTLNDQGRVNARLQAQNIQLTREMQALQSELDDCRRVQAAMRRAVYMAGESL